MSIQDFVYHAWGVKQPSDNWFPGPQPVSIERRHFALLKKSEYMVCEKMDGVRHLLVSTDEKKVALVDRSFHITPINYTLPKNTLLDGELVTRNDGKQVFLVHDAVMIRGEDLKECPLTERLEKSKALVRTILSKSPFVTIVKPMYPLKNLADLKHDDNYITDGLIFTPVHEPIRTGTHETLFKWKPREHITIDFQVQDSTKLYIQERGRLILEAELHNTTGYPDGTIVECDYGETGWRVVRVRTDKTYPNNRRTFLRTIVNLRENIQKDEFL